MNPVITPRKSIEKRVFSSVLHHLFQVIIAVFDFHISDFSLHCHGQAPGAD